MGHIIFDNGMYDANLLNLKCLITGLVFLDYSEIYESLLEKAFRNLWATEPKEAVWQD